MSTRTMKAVADRKPGAIERDDALQDITLDQAQAQGRDLLVKVHAVSVNPVDTKLRVRRAPEPGGWDILGFDAGRIRSTATETAGRIDAATWRRVHAQIESGTARGKIVLEGF